MNSPFKFLEPYEKKDKNIFFGRDKEIELLYNTAFTTNLILVYGQTGTGKTSLIRCGLANRFQEGDWFDLYIRRGDDIILSLWKEIYTYAETPVGIEASVTDEVKAIYRDFLKPVYLIFDQFEELFILGTKNEQRSFFNIIAHLLESGVPVKIIFIMREDYIARLYDFEKVVPRLFNNRIRIETMHLSRVEEVIVKSAVAFNIQLETPTETIKRIIENNKDKKGTIQLPYLQVYLDRLYRKAATPSNPQGDMPTADGGIIFTPFFVERVGKINDVMALFLDEQTQQMQQCLKSGYPDVPDDVVWQVLNQFATAAGTSSPLQKKELYSKLPIQEDIIDFCLTSLEKARILHVSDKDKTYEIAHDALAQRIDDKRSVEEKTLLKIEKLVKDRFAAYEDTTALLTKGELNYIEPYEKNLKSKLGIEEINFIARSRKKASKRRTIIVFATAAIIVVLLLFAAFAAWQWKIAEARYIASQAQLKVEDDPTMALRIAEKAWELDRNKIVTKILHRIYATNNFYKIIAKHNQGIFCTDFSPDGKYILTGSSDHTARLWDWQGNQLMVFKHKDEVRSVAFSPHEKYILTGSSDHTARLWNWQGKQLRIFKHDDGVRSVAFSPHEKYILTGSSDYTARLWDWQGNQLKVFKHKSGVRAAAFSPDGKYVLTGSYDRSAHLWNLQRKRSIRFGGHQSRVDSVAFSPDGQYVLTGSYDGTARLWDRDRQKNPLMIFKHKSGVRATGFSQDGKYVLTGLYDGTVRLWDCQGNQMMEFKGHKRCVYSVIFSPGGKYILTGSGDNTARLWNWQRNQLKEFKGHSGSVLSVVFSPDGKYVLTGSQDRTARLWNIRGKQLTKFEGHEDSVLSVVFSPDGKYVLTGSHDKTARLWDLRGNQLIEFEGDRDSVLSVVFSPDGKYVLTGLNDGTIRLWDRQGNQVKEFKGHKGPIYSISISPNGKYILTGSTDKTARLWDWQGKQLKEFKHKGFVKALAFSPDGEYILIGSTDKTARLWDWQGKQIQVFKHESGVRAVGFSPDGKYVITGSYDKIVRLWDWQGNRLQEFKGHIGCIYSVAFSPDGKNILTGSDDQTACLWEIMAVEDFLKKGHCEKFSDEQLKKYGIED